MASKSGKLYSDTPSLKRDKSGEVGVSKPSEADAEDMGIAGNPLPHDGSGEMPIDVKVGDMHGRHEKEVKDMHKRHEDEHKDMNKRHIKEAKATLLGDQKTDKE